MADRKTEDNQREPGKKKDSNSSCLTCTLTESMRDQLKATRLLYSPRRAGRGGENVDENNKSCKSTKLVAKSSDSSLSDISSFLDGREKRKSLQILQPSADGQKLLVRGGNTGKIKGKLKRETKSRQTKSHLKRNEENLDNPSSSSEVESSSSKAGTSSDVQTSSDEAYALMVQAHAPEKYWELVAEERRKALEETLQENMKLYETIEKLKAENEALREKANQADYYATMYQIAKGSLLKPETTKDEDV